MADIGTGTGILACELARLGLAGIVRDDGEVLRERLQLSPERIAELREEYYKTARDNGWDEDPDPPAVAD